MEADLYHLNDVGGADQPYPTDYHAPPNAKYYKFDAVKYYDAMLLPIRNIIIDDETQLLLLQLNDPHQPNPHLRKFKMGLNLEPIEVRSVVTIDTPDPDHPLSANIAGIGAPTFNLYPIATDYLYQVIKGNLYLAASIYLKYDHISAIIQF